ncbi:hypothetical protein ZOSMA_161G00080 [Zostera marina]|uniref:Uncharacterized protein n=1 Tax=Zostera marina TaxID=29655 RepID=A0A0K9PWE2_ZOSMR|nr:hypothetical protein ZOSMA_161G00080 [Zostera marina]
MDVKPAVALRALLVGGIAAFAKVATALKTAGGLKAGTAAVAMAAAATATTFSGNKNDDKDCPKTSTK